MRQRIASVDHEIEDGVFKLIGVGVSEPKAARKHRFQLYRFTHGSPEEFADPAHQLVDVDRSGIERLLSREGEQPIGQVGGAAYPLKRHILGPHDPRSCRGSVERWDLPGNHVEPALNNGQEVIEIVRNAASELSYGLHLLGLTE